MNARDSLFETMVFCSAKWDHAAVDAGVSLLVVETVILCSANGPCCSGYRSVSSCGRDLIVETMTPCSAHLSLPLWCVTSRMLIKSSSDISRFYFCRHASSLCCQECSSMHLRLCVWDLLCSCVCMHIRPLRRVSCMHHVLALRPARVVCRFTRLE